MQNEPLTDEAVFDNSAFCLIGESLRHSFSPLIHKSFGIENYSTCEIAPENLEKTLKDKSFKGFNVTIPYKQEVMRYCNIISEEALEIGSVNTIVRKDNGRLFAYNTDIDGFLYCASLAGIDFHRKKVLVLGSGGTSLTARYAARESGASKVTVVSRSGKVNYSMLGGYADTDIIVNTTPVGMYPNNLISPVKLELFPNCSGLIDVIYNPRRTALIMDAKRRGIPSIDGLPMLVYQAKRAQEIFLEKSIPDSEAGRVLSELRAQTSNIILIGMPGSGKTSVSKLICEKTGKQFIDIDTEIEKASGKSIPEIFESCGEDAFRALERDIVKKAGMLTGCVIATGGGVVKDIANYAPLHQNGRIYCLARNTSDLDALERPLSQKSSLEQMRLLREPMYRFFADVHINNFGNPETAADRIIDDFFANVGGDAI